METKNAALAYVKTQETHNVIHVCHIAQ